MLKINRSLLIDSKRKFQVQDPHIGENLSGDFIVAAISYAASVAAKRYQRGTI